MRFTNPASGKNFAKDPAVVHFGGRYLLYHSLPPTPLCQGWSIGIAESTDLENWEIIEQLLPTQECEQKGICAPGAIVLNGKVHLFYQTYGNGALDAICHAVSEDGVHFEKNSANPVLRPDATWCCGRAIDADVCLFHGKLLLYFASRDHAMQVQKVGGAWALPDSDFTPADFHPLADQSLLLPEMKWEGSCIEAPATLVHDDKVWMFYGGSYNCTPQQVGCAVSEDGIHFHRISNQPLLTNGAPGSWNSSESGHPYVFEDNGRIWLFYQGSPDQGQTWYISKAEIVFRDGVPHILAE
ncbi:MAG: family 43 glycosylhydrolase [Candidatus Merdivicinus sp.]|jgi:beta-xylosidase